MSGWTPGPWVIDGDGDIISHADISGDLVANQPEGFNDSMAYWSSNAQLIAAAPDLYDACAAAEDFCAALPHNGAAYDIYLQLHAALSRARGEQP